MKASNSVLAHGTASGEDIEWYEVIDGVRVERESMGGFEMELASWLCHLRSRTYDDPKKRTQEIHMGGLGLLIPGTLIEKAEAGYGRCSQCSCPGFRGPEYTCWRSGCSHHYDQHW
jgi:hypothetical protein